MNTCPACGVKIDWLYWWSSMGGELQSDWQLQTDPTETKYKCPECETALFSNRDNAKVFLANETYPNDTAFYKCSRCNAMVNRVYYHVWQAGDLCEKCHDVLKHRSMLCKVEDGGSVDLLYAEELEPLWRIKLKTGKRIAEQILEAIKDYSTTNLTKLEKEDQIKIGSQD